MVISNLETLKVMSDSRRLEIMEVMRYAGRPVSTKEIAQMLKLDPHKLYYHIKLLEEHGVIIVAESRVVANLIEKYYVPAALLFKVDESIFASADAKKGSVQLVSEVYDQSLQDIMRAVEAGVRVPDEVPQEAQFGRSVARLSDRQAAAFAKGLLELLDSINTTAEDPEADTQTYFFTYTFLPMVVDYDADE